MSDTKNDQVEFLKESKESYKMTYDFFKHLTTVNTGVVFIIGAFLDTPLGMLPKIFTGLSVIAFVISLAISLWAMTKPIFAIIALAEHRIKIVTEESYDNSTGAEGYTKRTLDLNRTIRTRRHLAKLFFILGIGSFLFSFGIQFF